MFVLANENKKWIDRETLFVIYRIFGWKIQIELRYRNKNQVLHAKNFCFVKFIFEHRSKFATQKEINKFPF